GATAQVGRSEDHIELIDGEKFKEDPFQGAINRWTTVPKGAEIESAISQALKQFDFLTPEKNIPQLLQIKRMLDGLGSDQTWVKEKQEQIDEVILGALGVKAEFLASKELSFPSEKTNASLVINNPSAATLKAASFSYLDET